MNTNYGSLILTLALTAPLAAAEDKPSADNAPAKKQPFNPLDEEVKQSLGEGEDVGAPEDPLVRIGERMRSSEQLIGDAQTGDKTQQLQQQIIADLDRLIQQAQQQQNQSPSSKPSRTRTRSTPQPQRPSGQQAGQPQNSPARDSSDKMRADDAQKAKMGELKKSLDRLWGDLPERARDEALQSLGDSFLPKYDLQIRKYFQRLGEEDGQNATRSNGNAR